MGCDAATEIVGAESVDRDQDRDRCPWAAFAGARGPGAAQQKRDQETEDAGHAILIPATPFSTTPVARFDSVLTGVVTLSTTMKCVCHASRPTSQTR